MPVSAFKPDPIVAVLRARCPVSASRVAGPALLLSALALLPVAPVCAVDVPFGATDISSTADGARSTYAADLDGDGDVDLLSASEFDDKIAW